jgi:hypothetical protein
MFIRFFTEKEEYAQRTRDAIPRKGDFMRFNGMLFKITHVIWCEDEKPDEVHIGIKKLSNNQSTRPCLTVPESNKQG